MPGAAARIGDSIVTGHLCASATTIAGPGAVAKPVMIEGKLASLVGDLTQPHDQLVGIVCVPHTMPIVGPGAPTVIVNGKPLATMGDIVDSGTVTGGATTVFAGLTPPAVP